ncbi:MAG: hypothetical protein ACH254_22320 [Candidatus Thiodiazotropha endolucinida]
MGEIRFVGTGETGGYPYLVCKKIISRKHGVEMYEMMHFYSFIYDKNATFLQSTLLICSWTGAWE